MKWTILILSTLLLLCQSPEVKEKKDLPLEPKKEISVPKEEVPVEPKKEDTRSKYLSKTYAAERLIKNQTDSSSIAKAKALINEANTLLKLKKNEDAIQKYEEAFEIATDPEAFYRYGNALSNIQKLEESIQAYDIAIELGYEKPYYALYNKACSYSLLQNSEESFKFILLSVEKGYKAVPYMQEDPDLQYVRSLPEWKAKYKEIKKRAREREELDKSKG